MVKIITQALEIQDSFWRRIKETWWKLRFAQINKRFKVFENFSWISYKTKAGTQSLDWTLSGQPDWLGWNSLTKWTLKPSECVRMWYR